MNALLGLIPGAFAACVKKYGPKIVCKPTEVTAAYERMSQVARNFMDGKIVVKQINGINTAYMGKQWYKDQAFVEACEGKFLGCETVPDTVAKTVSTVASPAMKSAAESTLLSPISRVVEVIGLPATIALGLGTAALCAYGLHQLYVALFKPKND